MITGTLPTGSYGLVTQGAFFFFFVYQVFFFIKPLSDYPPRRLAYLGGLISVADGYVRLCP